MSHDAAVDVILVLCLHPQSDSSLSLPPPPSLKHHCSLLLLLPLLHSSFLRRTALDLESAMSHDAAVVVILVLCLHPQSDSSLSLSLPPHPHSSITTPHSSCPLLPFHILTTFLYYPHPINAVVAQPRKGLSNDRKLEAHPAILSSTNLPMLTTLASHRIFLSNFFFLAAIIVMAAQQTSAVVSHHLPFVYVHHHMPLMAHHIMCSFFT